MLRGVLRRKWRAVRFGLAFAGYLTALALIFEGFDGAFARLYLRPTSIVAFFLLKYLGVEASLSFANLSEGFCDLLFHAITYRTYSCTGIFTCLIFVAGVLAYPASPGQKFRGLLVGIPVFFVFGTMRLALMGFVGVTAPDYISLFHRYIMVMVGVGIALFLWIWWVDGTVRPQTSRPLPA